MTAAQIHEDEALGKAYDSRLMRRLLGYVRPYRWIVIAATALLLVGAFLQISLTFLTQIGIDSYITTGDGDGFGLIALAFLGVAVFRLVLSYAENYLTALLGQKVQHDIRMEIFRKMQTLPLSYYDKNPVGRMLTRVTNDVNVLNELFSAGVVTIIGDLVMLVLIIGALLYYSWELALVTFMVLPLLIVATMLFRKKVRETYRNIRTRLARLNAFMQEHLTGISLVQLFRQEQRTHDKFDDINLSLRDGHFKSVYYYAVFFPTAEIIGALSIGLLLYYGGGQIYSGHLTFGELVAFIHLVERFYGPIRDLAEKYNVLQSAMASSERVFELLDTPSGIERHIASGTHPAARRGHIELEKVWFAYNGDNWVLRDVSFNVEPGQKVAIVGATGAGKSSLISLLLRFYDYQKGSIKIDNTDVKTVSTDHVRSRFALVLQDVYLFSGDLAGNVRLRKSDISDSDVSSALEKVGFDKFLAAMSDGIHTPVKERGATLSTGQKQLLSFARALAFNPEILILDEATSSVDSETEFLIQQALDTLLEKRTAIIIAHRLSTIERADKIVVLHHGQVREIGTHAELIEKKGIYHTLYLMQYRRQSVTKSMVEATTR